MSKTFVLYLPKKIEGVGPRDGSAPGRVAKVVRRLEVGVLYPEIEQQLLQVPLIHPRGNLDVWIENDRKWIEVLSRFLVDRDTMYSINGDKCICSDYCLDEESLFQDKKMQFVDTARFALANCSHASMHLQCILSGFIWGGGWTNCPIADTPQCNWDKDSDGNFGEAKYWAPEDYYNFAKAFLRTKPLTRAFLKPELR